MNELYERLFDALTTEPYCRSIEEIADRMGYEHVGPLLSRVRRPEFVREWGWTVPHQPRGTGEHLFLVVLAEGDRLTADEDLAIRKGAASTCAQSATMNENEAEALRLAAQYLDEATARKVRRTAKAMDGVAAMAEDARAAILNGA